MRRLLVVMALILGVGILGAAQAWAHTALVSTDPAADASLTAGPARVSATFNEDLQSAFAAMTVVGPDGNLWSSGEPEVRGAVAAVAVRPLGPSGRYTVNYRVTSADGHVVSGFWSFTVTAPGTGTPGPPVSSGGVTDSDRIPLWPFAAGAMALVAGAALLGWRRRS